jgi:hypothetical protein
MRTVTGIFNNMIWPGVFEALHLQKQVKVDEEVHLVENGRRLTWFNFDTVVKAGEKNDA